jgi:hypothetical protein
MWLVLYCQSIFHNEKEAGHNLNFKNKFLRKCNLQFFKNNVGTTLDGNTNFPFKQGLLTRGRARFKHGGDVDGKFPST